MSRREIKLFTIFAIRKKSKNMTDEQLGQMGFIFNYNDVFYSFFYDDLSGCVHRSREYAISTSIQGEMILDNGLAGRHARAQAPSAAGAHEHGEPGRTRRRLAAVWPDDDASRA